MRGPHATGGFALPLLIAAALGCADAAPPPGRQQALVVVADDEDATTGWLHAMERRDGAWSSHGEPVPVVLGRGGVGPKVEGDGRSPQGIFPLGTAFGYGTGAPPGLRLPYRALEASTVCVDDPDSAGYNQLIEAPEGSPRDFRSSEPMRRDLAFGDNLYEFGVVVAYNPDGARHPGTGAGLGSCIFLHVWRGSTSPTAGCTAMPRDALLDLLAWLDPEAAPFLAQGSRAHLEDLAARGTLPFAVPGP